MGGDGIYASDFFKGAGDKGEGTLATSIGEPVAELESAKQFVTDYEAAGFNESYSAYGGQSYDAANIIIQAFAKALPRRRERRGRPAPDRRGRRRDPGLRGRHRGALLRRVRRHQQPRADRLQGHGQRVDAGVLGRVRDLGASSAS